MPETLTVRPATAEGRDRIASFLRTNDLPVDDLDESPVRLFVGVAGGDVVGAGRFEVHGNDGLLRSVVVARERRGRGYGSALCDRLEDRAARAGVETLYLLTTAAAAFFRERGYDRVKREQVPAPIQQTTQFTDLCPDSATCLGKSVRSLVTRRPRSQSAATGCDTDRGYVSERM